MAQFFKFLFASCLGTFLALIVLFFFMVGGIAGLIGEQEQTAEVKPNSVLHLKLDQPVPELMDNVDNPSFDINASSILGLHDILETIEVAAEDDDVKGIFLESNMVLTGFTANAAIREALLAFKESGKFVVAYAPYYSQGAYYLATASDEINLAPLGVVDWRGLSAQYPFFKDMLDRIGVHYEVFYAGKYKSASEPYRRNSMSEESREQTRAFLDELYRLMLKDMAATRELSTAQLRELANTYAGIKTEEALASGLVDKVVYREVVMDGLRERLGLDEDEDVKLLSLSDFHAAKVASKQDTDGGKIAVLIAEGIIIDGKGQAAQVGDKKYVDLIEEIAEDEKVKAVVLRVNSPGGSAMASDHIWHALMDLKATGKPLVVSMGAVAASGGYYIAAPGDVIYAEPGTITGSIGVVSAIPQAQGLLEEKLGIHFDSVRTGPYATGINVIFDMSEGEKRLLAARTDQMYETFLSRVSDGRGISVAEVDSIAQGRVWVGTMAKQIGLVDQLGDLDDALAEAAERANLDDYHTVQYPQPKKPWERLLEDFLDREVVVSKLVLRQQLGELYPYYQQMQEMTASKGPQMRLPLVMDFR